MGSNISQDLTTATSVISPEEASRARPWLDVAADVPYSTLIRHLVKSKQIKLLMFLESVEKLKLLSNVQVDEQIDWIITSFIFQRDVFNEGKQFKYSLVVSDTDFDTLTFEEKRCFFDPMIKDVVQILNEAIQICKRKQTQRGKGNVSVSKRMEFSIFLQRSLSPVI